MPTWCLTKHTYASMLSMLGSAKEPLKQLQAHSINAKQEFLQNAEGAMEKESTKSAWGNQEKVTGMSNK